MRLSLCVLAALAMAACGGASSSASSVNRDDASAATTIPNSVPGFVGSAKDLGAADASQVISVTAWLKLQNENKLDQLVQQQRTKGQPNYHRWLNQTDFNAQFSPTSQQVNAVTNFLSAHNLTVIDVAENNFYVRVSGTVADIEKTFKVQIDNFSVNGEKHRGNVNNPNDGSGGNIAAVTGLDDLDFKPALAQKAADLDGAPVPLTAGPDGVFFSKNCFPGAASISLSGAGHTASFSGNSYNASCGYGAANMRGAYGLGPLYAQGLDGSGQTIAIIDEWGSDTIAYDADVFSYYEGLPRITSDNFQVVKAAGLWHNTGNPHWADWSSEVTLDVEWAHAIAPGAKIALVVAPDQSLFEALNMAVARGLGNTISNSWSNFEGFMSRASVLQMERILKHAAAKGIDVNFSSGDYGNNTPITGGFITVAYPASSPNATGVGGTSLALNPDGSVKFETGWGTNITMLWNTTWNSTAPAPSPLQYGNQTLPWNEGFIFGAGGGSSYYFAKPAWQANVPGATRQEPDISMDADPYTGVEIIQTIGGTTFVGTIGGTSLACPMFSGLMAIASQAAGRPIGQVAPLLYGMSSGIRDVHAVTSSLNVTGNVDGTSYTADQLAGPIDNGAPYYSALYHGASTRWYTLTFGTDTTLATGDGWDNVTGLGVPDGVNFINAVTQ